MPYKRGYGRRRRRRPRRRGAVAKLKRRVDRIYRVVDVNPHYLDTNLGFQSVITGQAFLLNIPQRGNGIHNMEGESLTNSSLDVRMTISQNAEANAPALVRVMYLWYKKPNGVAIDFNEVLQELTSPIQSHHKWDRLSSYTWLHDRVYSTNQADYITRFYHLRFGFKGKRTIVNDDSNTLADPTRGETNVLYGFVISDAATDGAIVTLHHRLYFGP